jgi:F0F1-type ATP synthase assembly protein I
MADDGSRNASAGGRSDGLRGRDLVGLGGLLVGSVVVFTGLGYVLDAAAGTSPAFTLLGIAVGMVGGAVGFWLRVRSALRDQGSS